MKKWVRAVYQPCMPIGDNFSRITESERHINLSRRAACEGTVLLKNEKELLPLKKGSKVAVFGKAQIDYVKGGGGSGDVHSSYVRNIYQGLKQKSEIVEVFDELSLYYQSYVTAEYKKGGLCGMVKECALCDEIIKKARDFTDTAIITVCRYSGEGYDRKNDGTDDYFYLSKEEKEMVIKVTENFDNIIVLLNAGAMIDTSWFAENDKIKSVLFIWQGGMEGGLAAADVLVGDANPSGKLVDTCACEFDDYPSSAGFHLSEDYVKYEEDIFVGYRYFETVPGMDKKVIYPFGYGLSYTTFELSNMTVFATDSKIYVCVDVKNTGKYAGKEVVQAYYSAPMGKITKAKMELCGFKKTRNLKPGETENIIISFDIKDMASYDDTGAVEKSCYILESGEYKIFVGTSVRDVKEAEYKYIVSENTVVAKLTEYCAPRRLDRRLLAEGTFIAAVNSDKAPMKINCTYKISEKPEEEYMLIDVFEGKVDLDTFIAQMTEDELCEILGGQPRVGVTTTSGMGNIERLGIPELMTGDGPAGVRIMPDRCVTTTAFPVATMLACTWNLDLVEEIGHAGALETKENNMSIWLTPALNIHRSPLCGRNFEYYSEDPFVSGKMAAAMVRGIQAEGIVAVPKHFACNNKETNRFESDSILSERALREIYLKGFEICVKESSPRMIMTAYNVVNGIRASENTELIQGILRDEWGFDGMITSDWSNHADHSKEVMAGNDIKMSRGDKESLKNALASGELKIEEIALCAKRILEMILWAE